MVRRNNFIFTTRMAAIPHIKLSDLNGKIRDTLHDAFGDLTFWVIADVTNHTFRPEKNYHNFELVEKDSSSSTILAKISAKAWGTGSTKISQFEKITGQRFTNNLHVLLNVSVQYHPVFGLQVNVNDVDSHFALGMLEQQRRTTLLKLVAENPSFINRVGDQYITANKQLTLPSVIQKIALICSATSAGAEDFRHTLRTNAFGFHFEVDDYFTTVQGENNAQLFVDRIIEVFRSQQPYDAVIITRGGGTQTDLLIFDHYLIGKAVAKFPIPIITGIGHQKNETIADLMAHTPTKTPTKAAEFIIAHNKTYEDKMLGLQKMIIIKSQQLFSAHYYALSQLNSFIVNQSRTVINRYKDDIVRVNQVTINKSKSLLYGHRNALVSLSAQITAKPRVIVYNRKHDIQNKINNLSAFQSIFIKNQKGYLGHYASVIRLMSPVNILKKGFAIVKQNDKIISDPGIIAAGSDIEVVLSGSTLLSTVKRKSKYNGKEFDL